MTDQGYVVATAAVIVGVFILDVVRRRFDPFAPVWLFLVGYLHVYVIQAVSLRDYGLTVRGMEVVTEANFRALWALILYLGVYKFGPARLLAGTLPKPPTAWSVPAVALLVPVLVVWGFFCAYAVIRAGWGEGGDASAEVVLAQSFPFFLLVAGILLIVTGRSMSPPNRTVILSGVGVAAAYVLIWMFNGKRSHSLVGVLTCVCALYITRQKRPSWPVLFTTAFAGALVVALAIGWRNNHNYSRDVGGFIEYVSEFEVAAILESLNIENGEDDLSKPPSYETLEYGGYLLMLDTVPEKSPHDYGSSYLRTFSTYIPRIVWPDKPIFGREEWVGAWIAGSESKRDETFTGPAIGILGATQLNGGAIGTFVVIAVVALLHRVSYEYFLNHAGVPWVQAWWALTYYNAWFMVVNDDPMVWFYYNWGLNSLPNLVLLWGVNHFVGGQSPSRALAA